MEEKVEKIGTKLKDDGAKGKAKNCTYDMCRLKQPTGVESI